VGTALVTDAELMSSVAVIRSLGRAGWRVVAVSTDPRAPGLRSRYTSVPLVLGSPDMTAAEVADRLLAVAAEHAVDVLIPVTDNTLLALSPVRDRLPPGCTLATADEEALHATMDKAATLALAASLDVPFPDIAHVTSVAEARDAAEELGWPVVVKPRFSRVLLPDGQLARCTTSYAFDQADLAAQMAAQPPGGSVLLQRYHPGEAYSVCMLTVDGQPRAAFSHRRLREVPPSGGVSALRESVAIDPLLDDYARRLLRALRWTGVAMVEFKVDDGRPLLMEINGRIWGSLPLATRAGLDFPRQLAELFLHGVPKQTDSGLDPVDTDYRIGVRSRRLGLELDWIEAVLRQRDQPPVGEPVRRWEAVKAAAQLFYPSYGYDGVARDDLRPGLADLATTGRRLGRRISTLVRRPGSDSPAEDVRTGAP
jgi:predicted ATP-grasp superfamily ATP-dependent carboligase